MDHLDALQTEAVRLGYKSMRLETGNRQSPAMELHESYGFSRIERFGGYVDDPASVCYQLNLAEGGVVPTA